MPVPLMKTPRIPSLACIGFVSEVGAAKETEDKGDGKPNYYMIPVTISPRESGRKKVVNFMFRPEWFETGFDPNKDIKDQWGEKANGPLFVSRRLFGTNSTMGTLTGLVGGAPEMGDALYDAIQAALKDVPSEEIGSVVQEVLRDALVSDSDGDKDVGYIVSQQSKRVKDEANAQWETVYTDQTEVSSFWLVNEKNKAEMERRAKRQKDGLFRCGWEVE